MTDQLLRKKTSLSTIATKALESVGLLNKGSAAIASGDVEPNTAEEQLSITSPTLNVTRVGGLAALVASVGAAALALLNIDRAKDSAGVVAAGFGAVGVIVAASLVAAAVIVSADIRARAKGTSASAGSSQAKKRDESAAEGVAKAWGEAVDRLEVVREKLPSPVVKESRRAVSLLCADAHGAVALVADLIPATELRDEHASLSWEHMRVNTLLEKLIDDQQSQADDVSEIRALVTHMRETVNNFN